MDDRELLMRYAVEKDQEAFGRLVRLHMDWVYGCARRVVQEPAMAEDVAQAVFILLARKAGQLRRETHLAGWLFRATRYCAAEALRGKARRLKHEREAAMLRNETVSGQEADWEAIRPVVDEAVAALGRSDRDAILLRFFRGLSLEQVGQAMGTSEEAAKKRVQRAVVKLRELLQRRGVSTSAGALSGALAVSMAEQAPAVLADATIHAVVAGSAATAGTAMGLAKGAQTLFVIAQVKAAGVVVAVSAVAVTAGTAVVVSAKAPVAATQPPVVAVPMPAKQVARAPEPLDGMYEKARRSSEDLEIMAGPNRFRVAAVARWDSNRAVLSDGRGHVLSADTAPAQGADAPQHTSEDAATVSLDTLPDRFDVRRLRVFDHDRREYLRDVAVRRIPGTSTLRISRWFAPLPHRIDLWMDLASHAADSQAVMLEPKAGASAAVGGATVRIREVRDGRWGYRSTQNPGALARIEWDKPDDQGRCFTIALDCIGAWQGGRYQMAAVTATGQKVLSDYFEDLGRNGATTIRDFSVPIDELTAIELRPFARPGPFFFDGVILPQRTSPQETFAIAPPGVVEGQWEAQMRSGPIVGVTAIADAARPDAWWTPDGEPAERPNLPEDGATFWNDGSRVERWLQLRIEGLPRSGETHLKISGASAWSRMESGGDVFIKASLPTSAATTDISIGVATQPWKVLESFALSQNGWMKNCPLYIRSVKRDDGKLAIVMECCELPDGMRMDVVTATGQVLNPASMRSASNEQRTGFGLPFQFEYGFDNVPAGVVAIRVQWRPIEYVQFGGVRLNPK